MFSSFVCFEEYVGSFQWFFAFDVVEHGDAVKSVVVAVYDEDAVIVFVVFNVMYNVSYVAHGCC